MSEPNGPGAPRRVVTGVRNGRSVVVSDGVVPNFHRYDSIPGMTTSVVYATAGVPALSAQDEETAPAGLHVPPAPGETRLMIVRFPSDSIFMDPGFDGAAADAEQRVHIPGLAEAFEPDAPGMHTTDTLDYDIVLDGEIWLELDEGEPVHLRQGDIAIQRGTRHAWRNRGSAVATMCFVLVGARRD